MNKESIKLNAIVRQCNKHAQRLEYAYSQIVFLLPFSAENGGFLIELDQDSITFIKKL